MINRDQLKVLSEYHMLAQDFSYSKRRAKSKMYASGVETSPFLITSYRDQDQHRSFEREPFAAAAMIDLSVVHC